MLWPPKKPYGSRCALPVPLPCSPQSHLADDAWDSPPPRAGYDKLYADDTSPVTPNERGEIYRHLGIDPKTGCVALVRPDQTVSLVCALDEIQQVGAFLSQFMVTQL